MFYTKRAIEKAENDFFALTYDDVRLIPGYSEVLPDNVNLTSRFSRNVPLKIPLVSAAMDTVTESKFAIEIAKHGGLGIIHKNLSPEEQAAQVARVKYHLNGKINTPIWVKYNDRVEQVLAMREEKGYTFHSFPVLNEVGNLVGIVTRNDFDFCDDLSKKVKDIMSPTPMTSSEKTSIKEAYKLLLNNKKKILPLINKDGNLAGMYVFSDVKRIVTGNSGMYNLDSNGQLIVGAAIGVYDDAFSRLEELVRSNVDVVVIDTAHAHSKGVIETLETLSNIKKMYPSLDVVVGNIATGEAAKALVNAGADGIKVGIGPGSICTTRIVSGVGTPQVSAIYRCVKAIQGFDIPVCGDGGAKNSGDITIGIATGADSIMLGNMFAGTEETPGETVIYNGRNWKYYRGMGSLSAMSEHQGSKDRYSQGKRKMKDLVPEGVKALVPHKGKLNDVLIQYVGGLKSGMGYVGASSIDELQEKAQFDRITNAGLNESHPHDVVIMEDSPNSSRGKENA
jgi:IMP dehydrogenase